MVNRMDRQRMGEVQARLEMRVSQAKATDTDLAALADVADLIQEAKYLRGRIRLALSALEADKAYIAANILRGVLEL